MDTYSLIQCTCMYTCLGLNVGHYTMVCIPSFILSNNVGISYTSYIDAVYKILAYYQVELSYIYGKDIDQTDLHRSEPSSLASICDEQPH